MNYDPLHMQLLADWSYYRTQTKFMQTLRARGARPGAKKMTDEIDETLKDLVAWCREHKLEPRLWIYALFKMRGWIGAPKLARGHLQSEKMIWRYRKLSGIGFFAQRRRSTAAAQIEQDAFDPHRDMAPATGALKRRFAAAHNSSECLDRLMEQTLGFHPKSETCQRCPLRQRCAIKIQSLVKFDIIGLRVGYLTSAEAEEIQNTYG